MKKRKNKIKGDYSNTAKYDSGNNDINEAYRGIRTFLSVDDSLKVILVTSCEMNEGKTTIVSNIARCFAELENKKTLIIDCDFKKKSLNNYFNIPKSTEGLSNIIYKNKKFDECVQRFGKLDILTCGTVHSNSSVLLESLRTKAFIESLRYKYDYIFIDSPPIGRVNDACIISKYVDGTVIVTASNEIDESQVKVVKERLENVNANIIGVILNKFDTKKYKNYGYYGYSYYNDSVKKGFFNKKKGA